MSDKNYKSEVFIRSDGWVFSKDGMDRLKAGGYKGFDRFKRNTEEKLGKWHRVLKPLNKDAAAVLMGVKGLVPRAVFLSSAITEEAARRAKHPPKEMFPCEGRAQFMRLTLTDDAYWTIRPLENALFREFVSEAILRAAKRRK